MVGQRTFTMIDSRLRQIFPDYANVIFGSMNLAIVGDFAQLPPVGDTPLYSPPSSAATENGELGRAGSVLYRLIVKSYRLEIIHRQLGDSPEQVQFREPFQTVSGRFTIPFGLHIFVITVHRTVRIRLARTFFALIIQKSGLFALRNNNCSSFAHDFGAMSTVGQRVE